MHIIFTVNYFMFCYIILYLYNHTCPANYSLYSLHANIMYVFILQNNRRNLFLLLRKDPSGILDRQNLAILRVAEKERRQQIENTAKKLSQAEVALETSKRKLDASKARIRVLEHELNVARANIAMLNEKRSHDDRLIEALNVSNVNR